MNTFQLDCFIAVADTLNFARAAERLGITQPAVTHQIQTLENELDIKLFARSTRSVKLTPEGVLFLNDAREILTISMRAKRRFKNPDIQNIQKFALGFQNPLYLLPFSDVFSRLKEEFPALHPRFDQGILSYLHQMLEDEMIDGIIGFQEPFSKKYNVPFRELQKVSVLCVCRADHPFADRQFVSLSDLASEKLVLTELPRLPSVIVELQRELLTNRDVSDIYISPSHETSLFLTGIGFGISFIPDLGIPPCKNLAYLPLEGWKKLSLGIYYKNRPKSSPIDRFIKIAREIHKTDGNITGGHV